MTIFGTRPEAIKMAPLVKAIEQEESFISRVVVTAQHREMLDQVLDLFAITPHYDLNIMAPGQTLYDITSRALLGLEKVLIQEKPDLVLVHGDTTTTFAAALAAYYQQIPVGHVEAGLRSRDKYSPFPEEINRKLTGSLADIHFAPTQEGAKNLIDEGVCREKIFVTGNTVIDALLATVKSEYQFTDPQLSQISFGQKKIILVTTHRRENLGQPMENIFAALAQAHADYNDIEIIFPVHKNPKVRDAAYHFLGCLPRVHLIEPLDYQPFANLMNKSYLILTDSGGLQEEAPALGKPVLVLRENTERPEAVKAGTVELVGTDTRNIMENIKKLLTSQEIYDRMSKTINPYGDGRACSRIIASLRYYFQLDENRPKEWDIKETNT